MLRPLRLLPDTSCTYHLMQPTVFKMRLFVMRSLHATLIVVGCAARGLVLGGLLGFP